jgi:hypothetical protein
MMEYVIQGDESDFLADATAEATAKGAVDLRWLIQPPIKGVRLS